MRRKDKDLSDPLRIREILSNASFCHVAMCNGGVPYCVPMCFAYKDEKVYLHSAGEGRKIEILKGNPKVCIIIEHGCSLITSDSPCGYGMRYESVMIEGLACFLHGKEKEYGLEIIAEKYAGYSESPYSAGRIERIAVIAVEMTSCTGRRSGPV